MPATAHDWRYVYLTLALPGLAGILCAHQALGEEPLEPIPAYANFAEPLFENYCFGCHSGEGAEAGLSLDTVDGGDKFQQHRAEWKKVLARLRAGDMPPADYDAPTDEERKQLVTWIEARLAELDCDGPVDPGWVTLRRLNRDQYRNTVRDLLGVDFEPRHTFPPDDLAFGFDNNGDILSLTPRLLEKYLDAAHEIAGQAIVTPETVEADAFVPPRKKWRGGDGNHHEGRALYSNGHIEFRHDVPTAGRYLLRVDVSGTQAGDELIRVGLVEDERVIQEFEVHADDGEQETFSTVLDVPSGKRKFGVAFLNDFYRERTRRREQQDRNLYVHRMELVGPLEPAFKDLPPGHKRWFGNAPAVDE